MTFSLLSCMSYPCNSLTLFQKIFITNLKYLSLCVLSSRTSLHPCFSAKIKQQTFIFCFSKCTFLVYYHYHSHHWDQIRDQHIFSLTNLLLLGNFTFSMILAIHRKSIMFQWSSVEQHWLLSLDSVFHICTHQKIYSPSEIRYNMVHSETNFSLA